MTVAVEGHAEGVGFDEDGDVVEGERLDDGDDGGVDGVAEQSGSGFASAAMTGGEEWQQGVVVSGVGHRRECDGLAGQRPSGHGWTGLRPGVRRRIEECHRASRTSSGRRVPSRHSRTRSAIDASIRKS
ncbi:MAG: hypothetical protein FJ256_07210 [Phycisphaerae bacterium]|nr:hypothetical protein [Phycisphaerae bacterium]